MKAIDKLRQYMADGNTHKALQLAASWPRLGEEKDAIQRGWAACQHPEFYRQIDEDPDALTAKGIAAIKKRYKI